MRKISPSLFVCFLTCLPSACLQKSSSGTRTSRTEPNSVLPDLGDGEAPQGANPPATNPLISGGDGTTGGATGGGENPLTSTPVKGLVAGPPMPSGDPLKVMHMPSADGYFQSFAQNALGGVVDFSCPGDSVLLGEVSAFDPDSDPGAGKSPHDRVYQFLCQFLTDGQGVPLRKNKCVTSKIMSGPEINYSCPANRYMAGQQSRYLAGSKDRQYAFECCSLETQEGKAVVTTTLPPGPGEDEGKGENFCTSEAEGVFGGFRGVLREQVNVDVNERRGPLGYSCQNAAVIKQNGGPTFKPEDGEVYFIPDAVLSGVKSKFLADGEDRLHSFFCCNLKIE